MGLQDCDRDALLAARAFVAFVDETYFHRWYCGKEWERVGDPEAELADDDFDALVRQRLANSTTDPATTAGDYRDLFTWAEPGPC